MTSEPQYVEQSSDRLIKQLQAQSGQRCGDTGVEVGAHEYLLCIIYGYADRPMTLGALADRIGLVEAELSREAWSYINARDCYREAWEWASNYEPMAPLVSLQLNALETDRAVRRAPTIEQNAEDSVPAIATDHWDAYWDAQDMGCGELLLELRQRISAIQPGQILCVRATDLGAPEDLPAWCGLVGHNLVAHKHPQYWISRRND